LKLDRREISQVISQIESREAAGFKRLAKVFSSQSLYRSVCFTGPGGVGKSSLLAKLLPMVAKHKSVCWLACDPWSPKTGGSLLGDRIRLSGEDIPTNAFVRSLSTRGTQAFSQAIRDIEIFMESLFDEVWVETAGSGQTQVEVAQISALTVLVLQPEIGDEIQWMKSGLRECADLFVINKSDMDGADSMMRSLMEFGVAEENIVLCSARKNHGLQKILDRLSQIRESMEWKEKVQSLQKNLALSLYREIHWKEIERRFKKESSKWIKNPYRELSKN